MFQGFVFNVRMLVQLPDKSSVWLQGCDQGLIPGMGGVAKNFHSDL
jgi:hypothetical protein